MPLSSKEVVFIRGDYIHIDLSYGTNLFRLFSEVEVVASVTPFPFRAGLTTGNRSQGW